MKAPDKIYIRTYPYDNSTCPEWLEGEGINSGVISRGVVLYEDIPYIRKDALLEWAKNLKDRWCEPPESKHSPGCVYMLEQVIDKLNSL